MHEPTTIFAIYYDEPSDSLTINLSHYIIMAQIIVLVLSTFSHSPFRNIAAWGIGAAGYNCTGTKASRMVYVGLNKLQKSGLVHECTSFFRDILLLKYILD